MPARFTIVGIGEALFDVFPSHQALGGAPLNAVIHAHRLAAPSGGRAILVSRVGQDLLGDQLRDELRRRGLDTAYLQSDPDRPTGEVLVDTTDPTSPGYEIVPNVAWDNLWFDPDVEELARRCEGVCFGSLAQRDAQSRNTIYRFVDTARRAVRLFDVNLRQKFYDLHIIRRSCELATVVKLNESELGTVCDLLGVALDRRGDADSRAAALRERLNLRLVALTRGERGTALFSPEGKIEGPVPSIPLTEGADAVGAGDAVTAALLVGLVLRRPLDRVLDLANHCGAFVAAHPGAVPELPDDIVSRV